MDMDFRSLPTILTGDAFRKPEPDNNNWVLKPDWMTSAEFAQWIEQKKERLRRRLAGDSRLLNCPEFRVDWDIAIAMEKCAAFHLFGQR